MARSRLDKDQAELIEDELKRMVLAKGR